MKVGIYFSLRTRINRSKVPFMPLYGIFLHLRGNIVDLMGIAIYPGFKYKGLTLFTVRSVNGMSMLSGHTGYITCIMDIMSMSVLTGVPVWSIYIMTCLKGTKKPLN